MSRRFVFSLCLGGDVVKQVVFPIGTGRRELRTSTGVVIGHLVAKDGSLRLDLDDYAAQAISDAQFHGDPY